MTYYFARTADFKNSLQCLGKGEWAAGAQPSQATACVLEAFFSPVS